jgi:hypothetical protein
MLIKEPSAPPPLGLNSHIYTSAYPKSLPSESTEKHTLCGFEGPEKVLEIWFRPVNGKESPPVRINAHASLTRDVESFSSDETSFDDVDEIVDCARPKHDYPVDVFQDETGQWQYRRSGLRLVDRAVWEKMLAIVKCQVLNVVNNECVDAYLLRYTRIVCLD